MGAVVPLIAAAAPYLATAATVAGAGLTFAQAQQQAGAARVQAAQARIAGRQQQIAAQGEEVRGQSAALDLREGLLRTLASQRARYAAAGVALGEATPATLEDATVLDAERQLAMLDANTRLSAASRRLGGAGSDISAGLLSDQASSIAALAPISAAVGGARDGINLFNALDRPATRPAARE
jgi:hypothetical protein